MFGRKYVFESKSTRLRRLLLSTLVLLFVSLGMALTFIIYIPVYAKLQKGRTAGAFFQKSPDAIAVFTGDKGRLSYAFELARKNPSAKLFISGVYAANSFQTLLDKQAAPTTGEAMKNVGLQVDLDYKSKNTFENVQQTIQFLKKNSNLKNLLIISSDYHIMRIKLIMSHYMAESKPELYFDSVPTSYSKWNEIKKGDSKICC